MSTYYYISDVDTCILSVLSIPERYLLPHMKVSKVHMCLYNPAFQGHLSKMNAVSGEEPVLLLFVDYLLTIVFFME